MDTILLLGNCDSKLSGALSQVGYRVVTDERKLPLRQLIIQSLVDLIIVDSRAPFEAIELCTTLRDDGSSKRLPIVFIAVNEALAEQFKTQGFDRVECVLATASLGDMVGKIATLLRLRKMVAQDSGARSGLLEMNASLRDLNERFTRELEEARIVQQNLLPSELPKDDRFEMAARYLPLHEVGGDMYDVRLEGGRVSFYIADVTGHGISTAFIGGMTKMAITASEHHGPQELLGSINKLLCKELPPGRFVTFTGYRYDPTNGLLEYARAGHPSTYLRLKDGTIKELRADGYALGFVEEAEFPMKTVTLEPTEFIFLCTDGLLEAQNRSKKFYGKEGMENILRSLNAGSSAEAILDEIQGDFNKFCDGRSLKDDVTLVVLKRVS